MQENIIQDSNKPLLDKIIFSILLFITFLTPIFFIPVTFVSTQYGTSLLFAFGVIVALLVYLFSGLKNGVIYLPKPAKYVLGSVAIVPLVYTLASISSGLGRMAFLGYTFDLNATGFILLGFAYLFLVSIFFREKSRIFYSYAVFVASISLLALFVLIRIIFGANIMSFGVFGGLTSTMLGNWNNVGILFGVGVILSLTSIQMISLSKSIKYLLYGALALSLCFVALVNYNMVWIVLSLCLFVIVMYGLFSSATAVGVEFSLKERVKKVSKLGLAVLVISTIFVFYGDTTINKDKTITLGSYLSNRLKVSNVEVRPSFGTTMEIAKNTIKQSPLFGSGPNTFLNQWLMWKPVDVVSTVFWNTDFVSGVGLLPTYAVTTGILGIISWLVFFAFYLYIGIKSLFSKQDDSFVRYLLVSSFFSSLFLWVMSFEYTPSTSVFIITLFFTGLFFAAVYYSGIITIERRSFVLTPRAGFVSSLIMVSVFVACLSLGYELYKNSKSLWYFQKSSYALNKNDDADSSEKYMLRAIQLVPYDVFYRSLSEIELSKMGKIVAQDPKVVGQAEIQKQFNAVLASAIKASLTARDKDSSNYLNWLSVGRIYEAVSAPELKIQNSFESSEKAYLEALKRNPKNPSIPLFLSRLSITHGDLKKARDYALEAVKIKGNYLDAYFLLTQIEVADNNTNGAIQSATAASIIDPTNPATFFQLGLLKYNAKDFIGSIVSLEKAISIVPDYANAKYFLGLSYEQTGQHAKAISQFRDLQKTNPDNADVKTILSNLEGGKPLFANTSTSKPEKSKSLPIKETTE